MAWKWLKTMFAGGIKETAESIGGVVEKFQAGHLGKKELQLELERLLHERAMEQYAGIAAELKAKTDINLAELQQGDTYTKRTRPWLVRTTTKYTLLLDSAIILIHIAKGIWPEFTFEMPTEVIVWWHTAWIGLCGVYKIGRSAQHVWPGTRFKQHNGDAS